MADILLIVMRGVVIVVEICIIETKSAIAQHLIADFLKQLIILRAIIL